MSEQGSAKALAVLGDGKECWYYDARAPHKDKDGKWRIEVCLAPTRELRKMYNISDKMLTEQLPDGRLGKWVEFKMTALSWLRKEYPATVFIKSNFDGTTSKFEEEEQQKDFEIERLQNVISNLNRTIRTQRETIKVLSERAEVQAKSLAKVILPLQDRNMANMPDMSNDQEVK